MKNMISMILRAAAQKLHKELYRFLQWIFSEKYFVVTVTVLANIVCSFLGHFFSPWQAEDSYFDQQIPLFHVVMSGVEEVLTAIEYGFRMPVDQCIVFTAMILSGVWVSKYLTDRLSAKYAPNRLCKILFEISMENITFYLAVFGSYILIIPLSVIIDYFEEYGILLVTVILLVSLIIVLPSSLYTFSMCVGMYAAFEMLNCIPSDWGKIIVTIPALAVNLLLDRFLTKKMFLLTKKAAAYLKEKLFAAIPLPESSPT